MRGRKERICTEKRDERVDKRKYIGEETILKDGEIMNNMNERKKAKEERREKKGYAGKRDESVAKRKYKGGETMPGKYMKSERLSINEIKRKRKKKRK